MESTQLKNIQNIENSLALLKFKIDKMKRLDNNNEESISKLIIKTIPVVQKKLKQSQLTETLQLKKSQYSLSVLQIRKKNQESRLINERQVTKSKQILNTIKHQNSLHLKQSKKVNEQKIRELKILNLNQKRQQMSLVKRKQEQSRAKIVEFHQQKKKELKLQREAQSKQNDEKMQRLAQKMKQLAKQQLEMEEKVKESEKNVHKFKDTIKRVDRMHVDQFIKLKDQLGGDKLRGSKSISQALLVSAITNSIQISM